MTTPADPRQEAERLLIQKQSDLDTLREIPDTRAFEDGSRLNLEIRMKRCTRWTTDRHGPCGVCELCRKATVGDDYGAGWKAQAEEIATLQAENARLTAERDALSARVENLKFDMNLVGAQLGISTREEIEPAVRKLLAELTGEIERHAHAINRAESAELALAEAAMRINCAGPVAHRIDVLRQEHEAQLREARAQALEDAAEEALCRFETGAAKWLRARAASERKEGAS